MRNKKRYIIYLILFVLILGIFIGSIKIYKRTSIINTSKMENLMEIPYTVSIINGTKDSVDINVIGDIDTKSLDDFTSKVYKAYNLSAIKNINLTIFKDKKSVINDGSFYTDGIIAKISIDYSDKKVSIGTFQTVPSISDEGKINLLNCYSEDNVSITVKDNNATINIKTDLNESAVNVVNQIKTYVNIFRNINSNVDFASVEMHLNSTSDSLNYVFNTDFENVLKTIKTINY